MGDVNVGNYQELAESTSATAKKNTDSLIVISKRLDSIRTIRLLHGAMGLCTESGELMDAIKKHIFYGDILDLVNISEECGDLFWYLAETLTAIDNNFIDVMQTNIDKLRARYPEKFTERNALSRDLDKERDVLKNARLRGGQPEGQ